MLSDIEARAIESRRILLLSILAFSTIFLVFSIPYSHNPVAGFDKMARNTASSELLDALLAQFPQPAESRTTGDPSSSTRMPCVSFVPSGSGSRFATSPVDEDDPLSLEEASWSEDHSSYGLDAVNGGPSTLSRSSSLSSQEVPRHLLSTSPTRPRPLPAASTTLAASSENPLAVEVETLKRQVSALLLMQNGRTVPGSSAIPTIHESHALPSLLDLAQKIALLESKVQQQQQQTMPEQQTTISRMSSTSSGQRGSTGSVASSPRRPPRRARVAISPPGRPPNAPLPALPTSPPLLMDRGRPQVSPISSPPTSFRVSSLTSSSGYATPSLSRSRGMSTSSSHDTVETLRSIQTNEDLPTVDLDYSQSQRMESSATINKIRVNPSSSSSSTALPSNGSTVNLSKSKDVAPFGTKGLHSMVFGKKARKARAEREVQEQQIGKGEAQQQKVKLKVGPGRGRMIVVKE